MPIHVTLHMAALLRGSGAGSVFADGGSDEATDPIPAARQTDWTYTGVPGGIPTRTTIFQTFSVGATAAQITTALNAAGDDEVVFLNAGTYSTASLGGAIDFDGVTRVTLRGAGMGVTILQGNNNQIITKAGGGGTTDNRVITGAVKGGFTFTVASATGLAVGNSVMIDRDDDPDLVPTSFGAARGTAQQNVITGISGLTITCRNPWFYDFTTGNPKLRLIFNPGGLGTSIGVEDLTIDYGSGTAGANFWFHDKSWFYRIETVGGTGYHFLILSCTNFEARQCYIHDGGSGPNNSGLNFFGELNYGCQSHFRIEDNIFNNMFPAIELNISSSGGYIGYNYIPGGNTGVSWSLMDNHDTYNMMNLYEGNDCDTWGMDGYFGGSGLGTFFRNYSRGFNENDSSSGAAVRINKMGYKYNVVGNVLGSSDQVPGAYESCDDAIYTLGYPNPGNCDLTDESGNPWARPGGFPDTDVEATLMRWGNYDYFNDTTRWETSELGGVTEPPDHTLIDSYVYNSQPSWWTGGIPWPPIGPDVTGGNGDASGHVNKIPARLRYEAL